eukprot:3445033-Pyramimonas_sp.AAC.2
MCNTVLRRWCFVAMCGAGCAGRFHVQRSQSPEDVLVPIPGEARHMLDALPGCGEAFDGGWNEFWD